MFNAEECSYFFSRLKPPRVGGFVSSGRAIKGNGERNLMHYAVSYLIQLYRIIRVKRGSKSKIYQTRPIVPARESGKYINFLTLALCLPGLGWLAAR